MKISVSILNSNNRNNSVLMINNTDADYIHIDVMDGQFVTSENFSIEEIRQIALLSKKKLDIHLMVKEPLVYINKLKGLKNIAYITIHSEIGNDISNILSNIKKANIGCGLAINPDTPIEKIKEYCDKVDLLLFMSVVPGLGGQKFIDITSKINAIKDLSLQNVKIEIDGGINPNNINKLQKLSVDIVVVGSYITSYSDYQIPINNLKKSLLESE